MKKILQKDEKVLRQIAKEVPLADIHTTKIKKVLTEMKEALDSQGDGVAIAAPQIGYALRIFVVSGKIFSKDFPKTREERYSDHAPKKETKEEEKEIKKEIENLVFINPKISKLSREKHWLSEGCLSVRPIYGKTYRSTKASVSAYDENGKKFKRGGAGLLAQIFQHETDHLNGILFIDHARDLKAEELPK